MLSRSEDGEKKTWRTMTTTAAPCVPVNSDDDGSEGEDEETRPGLTTSRTTCAAKHPYLTDESETWGREEFC